MIEIVKREDNPVSKFFSTKHNTTEIDVKELEKRCDALERAMSYSSKSNTLLSKFLQAIKERNESRELHIKALREREATEKEVDAMLERAQKAERERDEAMEQIAKLQDDLRNAAASYIAEMAIEYSTLNSKRSRRLRNE